MYFQVIFISFALMCFGSLISVKVEVCRDKFANCAKFRANGDCWRKRYENWMEKKCARSCELCEGTQSKCRDNFPEARCVYFANQHGICHQKKFEKWTKAHCARTCRFCDCKDWTYGCCEDGKTLADGPRKKGCAMKLCFDNVVCDEKKIHCDTSNKEMRNYMRENCPFTCGYCKPASPRMTCEQNNPRYGCCWNGQEATGPNQCPPCEDVHPRACFLWRDDCGKGNFYGVRLFLGLSCPKTCGQCNAEEAG